ncbi:MAG TPA: acetyl-CoA carboxylase biotin carboxylase subunit [Kofleriaceae bacterium]|nr:acetyl-CoA carboxylase biotin carboxylase subunit [Kofleriaceae bacterium]
MALNLFRRVLIANRGEVAVRIIRTCDELGIEPVLAVSEADSDAPYTRHREVVVLGKGRSSESYLDPVKIVQAAVQTRCTALHPGWGFLAESPLLATLAAQHGVTFIGPPPHVMARMGKKIPAKRAMTEAGLAVIPGSPGVVASVEEARAVAEKVGYPVLLKAESGGGGRGMRVAASGDDLARAFSEAESEAQAAFGDPSLYLEKLIEGGRHIEIQILADRYGHAVHLGERDCTIQRNHQKLLEESPSPVLSDDERQRVCTRAAAAFSAIGYTGAGTMELLLDDSGTLRFMEVNARLQVEHPVTEMRTGLDLVAEQLRIAAGQPLSFSQSEVQFSGHAIECRINAEDPAAGFLPSPGLITRWQNPDDQGGAIRVDTHVESGYRVPPHYDSLLCKLIAHGRDRAEAIDRLERALGELVCEGVPTTVPLHRAIVASRAFRDGDYDTRHIPGLAALSGDH